jgi:hypothetical protein
LLAFQIYFSPLSLPATLLSTTDEVIELEPFVAAQFDNHSEDRVGSKPESIPCGRMSAFADSGHAAVLVQAARTRLTHRSKKSHRAA